nr:retrovirus-related Pol polyprotein from transposon TNT 1-94 [Tanacetum cinerariifolium]
MDNLSEDIQCAGSDTRPPMLDRTDFASWQQHGTFRETLADGNKGALHLGLKRARVYSDLSSEDKERTKEKPFSITMSGLTEQRSGEQCKGTGAAEYFKDKMLLMQAQENKVVLDEKKLLFITGGQDNAVDEDVDEPPIQDLALNVIQIVLWYLDSGCSKHMMGNRSRLKNFVKKFIETVRFKNDHFSAIIGYEDYVISDNVIFRVYYVEGLGHNLFFVGQFYDFDLEVAFRKHSYYVQDTNGVELIKGSHDSNFYTISVENMMKSSPICLLSKASKNKSWLWHRRLNHLNFGTINDLARKDLVRGLPRLKFEKDHLCLACQLGKSKKHSQKPKAKNTIMDVLHILHMDLCGPMRVQSIIEKKYILVIINDYSRFTWVNFLRSNDETPEFVTKFLTKIQVSIFHQKSVLRTPQQNGVVERQNHTFVEAARMMLIFSKTLIKDLGKMQPTSDIGIFVGYEPSRKGYRIYNKRTRRIMETIHVQLDELFELMASVQLGIGLTPSFLTPGQISSGLNLVLKHQHPEILVQLNPFMLLNHIIIPENEARITRLIMSLVILLDLYPPENNL